MKNTKRIVAIIVSLAVVTGIFSVPITEARAAVKSYELEQGKNFTLQLDGKGAKEKLKFTVESNGNGSQLNDFGQSTYQNTITLFVNDKIAYETHADTERFEATGQVFVTSVDKSDKVLDIFVALSENLYTDEYLVLDYCRYENGKVVRKQDLKKYLDGVLKKDITGIPKKYKENYIYYHPMWRMMQSLWTNGNKELLVTVDLPGIYAENFGQFHADYALKLKNGKLVKKNKIPQGKIHDCDERTESEWTIVDKNCVFYTKPGGSKKAFTIKKGQVAYLTGYQYRNGKLYLKGESQKSDSYGAEVPSGKSGWIEAGKFYGRSENHI